MFRNDVLATLTACALALVLGQNQAQAQVKPFKVTGGGVVNYVPLPGDPPQFHFAVGNATELGNYYGEGYVQVLELLSPNTASFDSAVPFVFTAANGDKLAFQYGHVDARAAGPGLVTLYPANGAKVVAVFVAEFNPVPADCTGRFKKVIGGSFIMTAVTEPFVLGAQDPVAYTWEGDGSIEFSKGR
jgi:hypothetical protein